MRLICIIVAVFSEVHVTLLSTLLTGQLYLDTLGNCIADVNVITGTMTILSGPLVTVLNDQPSLMG